jgi:DNA-binding NtrC family response regulator
MRQALGDRSVFSASSDDEALKTLRVAQVELVLKEAAPPVREVPAFISHVRHLCPNAVVITVLPTGETSADYESAAESADFVLLQPFTPRHVQDVLRQADDKLRLLDEVAAFRSERRSPGGNGGAHASATLETSSQALAQVAKEFAKALAAGFDLPRVLD